MTVTAIPGRCACGTRVLRADASGDVITVDIWPATAAAELTAWAQGRKSYTLTMKGSRMELDDRTPTDIKVAPVGFRAHRVLLTHLCPEGRDE